ncbi:MAG: tRNA lysidine(34) synthetase TilS [Acidimicrobiales bacterium]|nr:tRNA lysidine(34) synthetase TilS [Acidimicrobiales bacterium]
MGPADDLRAVAASDLVAGGPALSEWLTRCTFAPAGTAVRCAVSGGADSLALLVLAVSAGLDVTAVHVDHQLREESASEAKLVAEVAQRFGAQFESHTVSVDPDGPNLEERARIARHEVLGAGVLTGHTADDQAETVLLQLMRGAGIDGIAGMTPGRTKPLLALRRTETEAVCRQFEVTWFNDPSNEDRRFQRNRVRFELLPLMSRIADRDVVPLLARSSASAREARQALAELLPQGEPTDTRWLQTLSESQSRLTVRAWLERETGRPISSAATDRVMAVVHHTARATELEGGWSVRRSSGQLELRLRR